ncbi:MAG: hypothetical protein ACOCQA_01885 [bacterium]
MKVYITNHAQDRWNEYCSEVEISRLVYIVKRHLSAALRSGLEKKNGAFHVKINRKINAVIKFQDGQWKVITFYLRDRKWEEVVG